jgi:hypothetical protein
MMPDFITIYRYDKKKYYTISIFKHKVGGKYSFLNITKQHICPCEFDTYEDAMNELKEKEQKGELKIMSTWQPEVPVEDGIDNEW